MSRKAVKSGATKGATAKSAKAKTGKSAKKKRAPGAKAAPMTAQLDAEVEYFHKTLRANAQLSQDTLLGPGETHTSVPDSAGRTAITRKRFSAT
ncbi:MAG TPA: hypothetical protein VGP25_05005 [Gemmatimonadaceae bacterium]|nr:hypothetical protein [Gemmatimonadaceae bacterium]